MRSKWIYREVNSWQLAYATCRLKLCIIFFYLLCKP
jgi:hypothetical protein